MFGLHCIYVLIVTSKGIWLSSLLKVDLILPELIDIASFRTWYVPTLSSITAPPLYLPNRRCIDVSGSRSSFSILHFTSIFTVYNSSTLQNNILIKIDGVVYSYRVEISNSFKYYTRNKLSLNVVITLNKLLSIKIEK